MKLMAPECYSDFQCIAGACRHSCCIGWEIDIDPASLQRFQKIPGEMGERLRQNIQMDGDTACFQMVGWEERCPFLNEDGLCDMILALGEDSLCQICTDHPRYRNFYADRTEIGLGLCCEAAGHLLLGQKDPFRLTVMEDDGADEPADSEETELLVLRDSLFAMLQNRSIPIAQRVENLLPVSEIDWDSWADYLFTLERMDEHWAELLEQLPREPVQALEEWMEIPLEQLICQLLYRHLPGALEDGDVDGRIRFCALVWQLITRLFRLNNSTTLDELVELARLYSSEIEYSDENVCAILEQLAQEYEGR